MSDSGHPVVFFAMRLINELLAQGKLYEIQEAIAFSEIGGVKGVCGETLLRIARDEPVSDIDLLALALVIVFEL